MNYDSHIRSTTINLFSEKLKEQIDKVLPELYDYDTPVIHVHDDVLTELESIKYLSGEVINGKVISITHEQELIENSTNILHLTLTNSNDEVEFKIVTPEDVMWKQFPEHIQKYDKILLLYADVTYLRQLTYLVNDLIGEWLEEHSKVA